MKSKSVQQKITILNEMVAWFDSDDFVLEQAVVKFKEAEKLAEEIRRDLEIIKNDINVLTRKFDKDTD